MINKAIILGRLGKDPETRNTQSGMAVCSMTVATSTKYKDKEQTEWHNVKCFAATAENCGKYLSKGSQVYIEGRIQTDKYTDKQGVEKYSTSIVADVVKFLDSGKKSENKEERLYANNPYEKAREVQEPFNDTIPF